MELIVEGKGSFLGKHQGRLRVTRAQQLVTEVPLIHLKNVIIIDSGVAISSDVVRVCSEEGIPIHFLESRGNAVASLYSAGLTGTVLTRRAQLIAYTTQQGVLAAKAFIAGKLANQANLLRYLAKYRKETNPTVYDQCMHTALETQDFLHELSSLDGDCVNVLRERLLSVEGRATQRYWHQVGALIPPELAWPGRETQGAKDPFNSALNYGYGILYGYIEQALTLAGLDPYGGFIHADRPGKQSLVMDCIEEFRQIIVDRAIIALVNKHVALEQDDNSLLSVDTRKKIVEKIHERLDSSEPYEKKRQALRFIIQSQARHLALFLRGERSIYEPFVAGW